MTYLDCHGVYHAPSVVPAPLPQTTDDQPISQGRTAAATAVLAFGIFSMLAGVILDSGPILVVGLITLLVGSVLFCPRAGDYDPTPSVLPAYPPSDRWFPNFGYGPPRYSAPSPAYPPPYSHHPSAPPLDRRVQIDDHGTVFDQQQPPAYPGGACRVGVGDGAVNQVASLAPTDRIPIKK